MTPVLSVSGLCAGYGDRAVISDFDMRLDEGEVLCLVGHNGAGKSTLLKVLFGLHRPSAGEIRLKGEPTRPRPVAMAKAGIAYLPEGRGIFPALTVKENFDLAIWSASLAHGEVAARIDEVLGILPAIGTFWNNAAGRLSGGQQQMVSIGRTLISRPSILLLDEPSIGLAPKLFQDLLRPVLELRARRKMSILLVEQNIDEAFAASDRVIVMRSGKLIFEGAPSQLRERTKLLELF
jgi:ABC-type branched-subunit amino acid transport system ATPase component